MRLVTYTPSTRYSSPSLLAANPFALLEAEMSRIFGNTSTTPSNEVPEAGTQGSWIPVDVHEEPTSYLLHAELPGVGKDDISIELLEGRLKLGATRRWKTGQTEHTQTYSRSIGLSEDIDVEKISASQENGLLTVILPKREQPKARKISVS